MQRTSRLLAVLAILAAACTGSDPLPRAGERAPDFRANDLTGRMVYLNAELALPVVLTFFATWCRPCLEEVPRLVDLHRRFAGRATFLCVVADPENRDKARAIAAGLSIPYPMLLDEGGSIRAAYAVRGLPATFLVGTDGNILSTFTYIGEDEARALAEAIERLGSDR